MSDRVGVIESVDEDTKTVNFAGYGYYIGEFTISDEMAEEEFGLAGMDISAPKIKLEDGREMWASGAVWYSDEESMQATLDDYEAEGYTIKRADDD